MKISFFSSIPSQKIVFDKKLTQEIDNVASTGSRAKYMKYVSFPWPPVVKAHDRKMLTVALLSRESYWLLIRRIQLYPSDPTIPFRPCRLLPIKIAFAMTINKSPGHAIKRTVIYPPSLVFSCVI
jgi:hypothetical protein